ncbi:uncharacterized protein CMC5_026360 [Chondromyces crocatus]|uniref:Uncharacterized protein n=1 Tax=Chondromyces crocatus TaxID=52 RepID=A0A0K1ECB0_CHOCO|nr:uncharacterized protein CMC5_026360 [Chondromyces crocatus]
MIHTLVVGGGSWGRVHSCSGPMLGLEGLG